MVSRKTWIVVLGVATAGGYLLYRKLMEYLKEQPPPEERPLYVPGRPEIIIKPIPPGGAPSVPAPQPPLVPQPTPPTPPEKGQPIKQLPPYQPPSGGRPPETKPQPTQPSQPVTKQPVSGPRITELVVEELEGKTWVTVNNYVRLRIKGKIEGTGQPPPPLTPFKPIARKKIMVYAKAPSGRVLEQVVKFDVIPGMKSFTLVNVGPDNPYMGIAFLVDEVGKWVFWAEADGVRSNELVIDVTEKKILVWTNVTWRVADKKWFRGTLVGEAWLDGKLLRRYEWTGIWYKDRLLFGGYHVTSGDHELVVRFTSSEPVALRVGIGIDTEWHGMLDDVSKYKLYKIKTVTTPAEVIVKFRVSKGQVMEIT